MTDTSELSFEESFAELEKVILSLEEGGLTLEASIATFEFGMRLAQLCNQHLERAELKVSRLQAGSSVEATDLFDVDRL